MILYTSIPPRGILSADEAFNWLAMMENHRLSIIPVYYVIKVKLKEQDMLPLEGKGPCQMLT